MTEKRLPRYLVETWELAAKALRDSESWIFVGYSLPAYDELIVNLLRNSAAHRPTVHVFDPAPAVPERYEALLDLKTVSHGGLPEALADLVGILAKDNGPSKNGHVVV